MFAELARFFGIKKTGKLTDNASKEIISVKTDLAASESAPTVGNNIVKHETVSETEQPPFSDPETQKTDSPPGIYYETNKISEVPPHSEIESHHASIKQKKQAAINSKSHTKKNCTKNGLPVFSENYDFSEAFIDESSDIKDYQPVTNRTDQQANNRNRNNNSCLLNKNLHEALNINSHKKTIYETDDKENASVKPLIKEEQLGTGKTTKPVKEKKSPEIWKDRKGIPRLSSEHDLENLMMSGITELSNDDNCDQEYTRNTPPEMPEIPITGHRKPVLKDKNRIPFIPDDIDLTKTFKADSENKFETLLHKNLSGRSGDMLLRAKKEKTGPPSPVTIEQRIKRYPAPQEDLDLHGFTAIEADRKTDFFIRSARKRELFTVRIIVGKGLHSQGRAVLPDVVEDRLAALKNEKEVLTIRWEKRQKSKSGSVIVYLNHFD
jgi:DNA-nicking Smr family endonuclease